MARVVRRSITGKSVSFGPVAHAETERTRKRKPDGAQPAQKRAPSYRSTRPSTVERERERAGEIVARVKALMIESLDTIRTGRRADLAALMDAAGEITRSVERNRFALINLTRLRSRHEYTYVHSIAVGALMVGVAREMGIASNRLEAIGLAGLVHDIGKARIPIELLDKPGALTPEERATVMTHSERGHALLATMGDLPRVALDVTLHHHERIDGSGYPHGLVGEAISIESRIAAVCDVYDALTSQRAYKDGWPSARALEWMTSTAGHFDPAMLQALRRLIGAFPPGALVRLRSDRLGVVLDDPAGDPSYPGVVAFRCAAMHHDLEPYRVDTRHDPILSIERPDRWQFSDWEAMREGIVAQAA